MGVFFQYDIASKRDDWCGIQLGTMPKFQVLFFFFLLDIVHVIQRENCRSFTLVESSVLYLLFYLNMY
jgi:hypothetical protein